MQNPSGRLLQTTRPLCRFPIRRRFPEMRSRIFIAAALLVPCGALAQQSSLTPSQRASSVPSRLSTRASVTSRTLAQNLLSTHVYAQPVTLLATQPLPDVRVDLDLDNATLHEGLKQ